jgi:hypothetical protein
MKSSAVLLLAAFGVAAALTSQDVQAAPLRIPAAIYPPSAHIAYRPALTNQDMDCVWGFFCEGNVPLFHFATQDQLHRVDGWAQFAGWRHQGKMLMAFALFASHYAPASDTGGVPWSARAFADLRVAIRAHGYAPLRHLPRLMPATDRGGSLAELESSGGSDLVVMACWTGSLEVEAIAMYDHHSLWAQRTALTDLTLQVQAALHSNETPPQSMTPGSNFPRDGR